ncbi:MAG TPA: hypothetical protein DCZ72_10335 [Armatimonadetes bacterium]|nr:hypothetical protein [Armatimonadota bacterium]
MRNKAVVLLVVLSSLAAASVELTPADRDGPLRLHNEFPFTSVFLATAPLDARIPTRERLEVGLSVANIYAIPYAAITTPAGQAWLKEPEKSTFDQAGLAEWAAGNGGRSVYLADTEQIRLDLTYTRPFGRRALVEVEVPLKAYSGGVLDPLIYGWHSALGFADAYRHHTPNNVQQVFFARGNESLALNAARGPRLGDTTVRGLYQFWRSGERGMSLAGSATLKLPTGSSSQLMGSGYVEGGLGLHATQELGRLTLYGTAGFNLHPGWAAIPSARVRSAFDLHGGAQWRFGDRFAVLGALALYGSPLDEGGRRSLGQPASLYSIAGRWSWDRYSVEFGMLENIVRNNNSHDFGLYSKLRVNF